MKRVLTIAALLICSAAMTQRASAQGIGDSIQVVVDGAEIRAGQLAVAVLPKGSQSTVRNVSGSWLLVGYTSPEGYPTSGWVNARDVLVVVQAGYAPQVQPTYVQPQQQYYTQPYYQQQYYQPAHTYHNTGHYHQHNGHLHYHNTGHMHHNHD